MEKLEAMNAYVKVVANGGYSQAAGRLGLTRSAVSKAITELETALGVRLLDRTTRRVAPTQAGLAYYDRCLAILAQVEDAESEISQLHDEPRGLLRVNGPLSFGILHLGDLIADFMIAYPDLRVELTLTDSFINPLEEGVDVTVRIGELADSSLIARRVAPARRVIVASPIYLEKSAPLNLPGDLVNHRCLVYGPRQLTPRWRLGRDAQPIVAPVNARLFSNNGEVLRSAALRGLGVTQLPTFLVGPDICAGRLAIVLRDYAPSDLGVHALYAPNRFVAAKTRVFIDFMVAHFGARPDWDRIPE